MAGRGGGRGVSGERETRRKCKRAIDSFQPVTSELFAREVRENLVDRAESSRENTRVNLATLRVSALHGSCDAICGSLQNLHRL